MADSTSSADLHCDVADNVVVVSGPDSSLDFEHSIVEVRFIYYMGNCQIKLQIGVPKFSILKLE